MYLATVVAVLATLTYITLWCVENDCIVSGSILFTITAIVIIYLVHERDKETREE